MNEIENELTNPEYICNRFKEFLSHGEDFVLSTLEKHQHGESFGKDEIVAKNIIETVNGVQKTETRKQLVKTTLQYENIVQSVSLLIAENNARLLKLIQE